MVRLYASVATKSPSSRSSASSIKFSRSEWATRRRATTPSKDLVSSHSIFLIFELTIPLDVGIESGNGHRKELDSGGTARGAIDELLVAPENPAEHQGAAQPYGGREEGAAEKAEPGPPLILRGHIAVPAKAAQMGSKDGSIEGLGRQEQLLNLEHVGCFDGTSDF